MCVGGWLKQKRSWGRGMTYLFGLGPDAEGAPKYPLRPHSGGTGTESWMDIKPNTWNLVNLMQTSSAILAGLLSQLQATKGSGDTDRHTGPSPGTAGQTSVPYSRVPVPAGLGQAGCQPGTWYSNISG